MDTYDALAWALHVNRHDEEALTESDWALPQGTRKAFFHYHRTMVGHSRGDTAAVRTDLTAAPPSTRTSAPSTRQRRARP